MTVTPADTVTDGDGYVLLSDGAPATVALEEPADLPYEVRTRITRSVVYTEHFATSEGRGVRVVGRKVPGVDGLSWQVRADPGTDATDPAMSEAIAGLVADLRSM